MTGVYIPMMLEIQMRHEPQWYMKLKELKSKSKLDIVGVAYDRPNWDLITSVRIQTCIFETMHDVVTSMFLHENMIHAIIVVFI